MPDDILGDGTSSGSDDSTDLETREDEEREGKRGLRGVLKVILVVAAIIIILLLLKDCGAAEPRDVSQAGAKTIEAVAGKDPVDGMVSIWVSSGTSVSNVLSRANVRSSGRLAMGGGRYVIYVHRGSEASAVKALVRVRGVYDAGFVYESKSPATK